MTKCDSEVKGDHYPAENDDNLSLREASCSFFQHEVSTPDSNSEKNTCAICNFDFY